MRSIIAKIAFAVIILCLLTVVLGITQPDSPSGTFQAATLPGAEGHATSGQPDE